MARHGDRVGRAATLLGRLKYCPPMFSDCAELDFSRAPRRRHSLLLIRTIRSGREVVREVREWEKREKKRRTRVTLIRRSRRDGGGEKWMSRVEKSVGTGLRETGNVSQAVAAHRDRTFFSHES